jgi:hypothetical protein
MYMPPILMVRMSDFSLFFTALCQKQGTGDDEAWNGQQGNFQFFRNVS